MPAQPSMMQNQMYGAAAAQNPSGGNQMVDSIFQNISKMNEEYYEEVKVGVNALVDLKVKVHQHDKVLDDQIDEFKKKIGDIEENIEMMGRENDELGRILTENQPQD